MDREDSLRKKGAITPVNSDVQEILNDIKKDEDFPRYELVLYHCDEEKGINTTIICILIGAFLATVAMCMLWSKKEKKKELTFIQDVRPVHKYHMTLKDEDGKVVSEGTVLIEETK